MANAQAGRNLDILELARLVVPIRQDQGGHGATTAKQGLTNLIVNADGVPFKDTDYSGTLKQDTLTANRTWTLPDASCTLASDADVFKKDGSVAMTGDFDGGGKKITNIADGVSASDALAAGQITNGDADRYMKLPNGVLIQWGASNSGTVTFPIAFPANVSSVIVTAQNFTGGAGPSSGEGVVVTSWSLTGFVADTAYGSTSKPAISWLAIGS